MNRVYRLVWSAVVGAWVCVAETARARGKTRGAVLRAGLLPLFLLGPAAFTFAGAPAPNTLPTGGQVVAGQASIQQNTPGAPASLTIQQGTQRAAIDWQSFNIGAAASVRFIQPSSQSVTLNRVLDGNPTQIFGKLSANGQVYLTNPSGVYFAPSASVEVGGLVATTHSLSNADFLAGIDSFDRLGSTGKVLNLGRLEAAPGGYIALLAPEVRNEGVIVANAGTVALAAGENITLDFGPDAHLAGISVTPAQIRTLVENRHAIMTEGGQIILAARSAEGLMSSVINSGTLNATSMVERGGKILIEGDDISLTAGSEIEARGLGGGGTVLIGGDQGGNGEMSQATSLVMAEGARIDASAIGQGDGGTVVLFTQLQDADAKTEVHGSISARGGEQGGNGGLVETSGAHVDFKGLRVDTSAPTSTTGNWLVDPYDLTIDSSAASTINTNLASTSVTLQTTASGTTGPGTANASGVGDININSGISWSSGNTLTLDAYHGININAAISAGNTGKVVMKTNDGGSGGDYSFGLGASGFAGNLSFGSSASSAALTINGNGYTLIYALPAAATGAAAPTGFQALATNLSDGVSRTASVYTGSFSGVMTGLGHTVSGFSLNPTTSTGGFFSTITGTVRDLGLSGTLNQTHNSLNNFGLMAGTLGAGTLKNDYTAGSVTNNAFSGGYVGGMVGTLQSGGTIDHSWSSATVNQNGPDTGGLVGIVTNGAVTAGVTAGTITNSYATGSVTSTSFNSGGLVGLVGPSNPTVAVVTNSYATGNVSTGTRGQAGGLIGFMNQASSSNHSIVSGSYASGTVSGGSDGYNGGLIGGVSAYTDISNSHATGAVNSTGGAATGGLIGGTDTSNSVTITSSYATGNVTATGAAATSIGGLVGDFTGTINTSFSTGSVSGYYYAITPTGALPAAASSQLAGTQTLSGAGAVSGASYTDAPTVSSGNITGFDLKSGLFLASTAKTTLSALNTDLSNTFGSGVLTSTNTATAAGFRQIVASTTFTVDTALTQAGGLGLTALNGDLTVNAAASAGTGTLILKGTGIVSDGTSGSVVAANLLLLGGNVTLDSASNAITTLAAQNVGSLLYNNAGALTIGSIGPANIGVTASAINGTSSTVAGIAATSNVTASAISGDLTVASNIVEGLMPANSTLTLKAAGNVFINGGLTIDGTQNSNTKKLNVVLWADTDGDGDGVIRVGTAGSGSSIKTDGGHVWMGGGSGSTTWNGLTVGNGAATLNTGSTRAGVELSSGSISTAGGSVSLNGNSSKGTASTVSVGTLIEAETITAAGGDIAFNGSYNNAAAISSAQRVGGVVVESGSQVSTTGTGKIDITGTVPAAGSAANSWGVLIGSDFTASTGTTTGSTTISAQAGAITITGSGTRSTVAGTTTNGIDIVAKGSDVATLSTTSGAITLDGSVDASTSSLTAGLSLDIYRTTGGISLVSGSGDVSLKGANTIATPVPNKTALHFNALSGTPADAIKIGYDGSTPYSGNILVQGDSLDQSVINPGSGVLSLQGTGSLTFRPGGSTFTDFSYGGTNNTPLLFDNDWNFGTSHSAITLGKSTSTYDVTVLGALTSAGNISIYGGNLAINAALTAPTTSTTTLLQATGNVTEGASGSVIGTSLALVGGNVTLTNATNNMVKLAASGVGNLSYVDADVLGLSTAGSLTGISATGQINVATLTGNLGVSQAVSTTDTSSAAITLNASRNSAAGASSGGNINVGGSVGFTTGTGGRTTLYTGATSDTTLATLIGSGTGRFRYDSDEATTNYTTALGSGVYEIYRQIVNTAAVAGSPTITYGTTTPGFTGTSGAVNGDTALTFAASGVQTSTAGYAAVGSYAVSATNLATLVGLGYTSAGNSNGTFTVNPKALTVSGIAVANSGGNYNVTYLDNTNSTITPKGLTISGITASNKVYDATTAATVSTAGAVYTGLVGGDVVTDSATGTFANKNVGTGKTVTLANVIGGADAGNYTITNQASTAADITPKTLTVSQLTVP
ncbi:MAG TPA: filamentous hemagglutinin N-terminal domain-containing protein [Burkholderiaceae bacterium]